MSSISEKNTNVIQRRWKKVRTRASELGERNGAALINYCLKRDRIGSRGFSIRRGSILLRFTIKEYDNGVSTWPATLPIHLAGRKTESTRHETYENRKRVVVLGRLRTLFVRPFGSRIRSNEFLVVKNDLSETIETTSAYRGAFEFVRGFFARVRGRTNRRDRRKTTTANVLESRTAELLSKCRAAGVDKQNEHYRFRYLAGVTRIYVYSRGDYTTRQNGYADVNPVLQRFPLP